MLADVADYLQDWHWAVAGGLFLAWVFLGGHLLRRNVLPLVSRRKSRANRCYLVALGTTVGGGIGAVVLLIFAIEFLKKLLGEGPVVHWLSPVLAMAGFTVLTYVALYASFELSAGVALRVWLRSFGATMLLTVAVAVPVAIHAFQLRHRDVAQEHSLRKLERIYMALRGYGGGVALPASLQELVDDKFLSTSDVQCRGNTPRDVDYFYMAVPITPQDEESSRLLACDYAENHGGRGRVVLLTNGKTRWCLPDEFARLAALEENRGFADGLRQAENKAP